MASELVEFDFKFKSSFLYFFQTKSIGGCTLTANFAIQLYQSKFIF
jgi:hypothetical protein